MSANVIKVNGDYKVKAAQGGTIALDAGTTGNVAITGSLTVTGDTILNYTTSNVTQNTEIYDNIIVLNKGEQTNQIRLGESGIKIDRGTNTYGNAYISFVEGINWVDNLGLTQSGLFVLKTQNAGLNAIRISTINTGGLNLIIDSGIGVISVAGGNYEDHVTDINHIPNKKYVDNKIALGGGGNVTITQPETSSTLTIDNTKTLRVKNSLTFSGTEGSSPNQYCAVNFAAGGTVAYTSGNLTQFAATTASNLRDKISGTTGSGSLVFNTDPTFPSGFKIGTGNNPTSVNSVTGTGSIVLSNNATLITPTIGSQIVSGTTGTTNLVFSDGPTLVNPTIRNTDAQGNLISQSTISGVTGTTNLVFSNSPILVTPTLGAASATSINGLTFSTSTGTLTIADLKTLTVNNSISFTSTDTSSTPIVEFGSGGTVAYTSNLSNYVLTTELGNGVYTLQIPDALETRGNTAKSIGYLGRPINTQTQGYAIQFSDQGKTIYTNSNILILANSILALPIGTVIHIIANDNILIEIDAGDTLRWGGQSNDLIGPRSLAQYGMATIIKVDTQLWYINGNPLS